MTATQNLSFSGTLYDSKAELKRAMTHEFITASGLNPIEWGVDEIERDLDGCARELYEDYEGKKHIEDLDEARELLRDWRDKHK